MFTPNCELIPNCCYTFIARDLNRGEGNEEHVKKPTKRQRTTQKHVPISPAIGLFGSIEQQISTTPKTPANKHKRKIGNWCSILQRFASYLIK